MAEKPSKAKLYSQAEQLLRERHIEEFHQIVRGLYEENGYTYSRRLSAEERAERKRAREVEQARAAMAALREKFPELENELPLGVAEVPTMKPDDFAGNQVRQEPYGAAHPVDPEAIERAGIPDPVGR